MEVRTEWVNCPVCGKKTRNKVRKDTVLKRFPLFCPKCKMETLIEIENLAVRVVEEPESDAVEFGSPIRKK